MKKEQPVFKCNSWFVFFATVQLMTRKEKASKCPKQNKNAVSIRDHPNEKSVPFSKPRVGQTDSPIPHWCSNTNSDQSNCRWSLNTKNKFSNGSDLFNVCTKTRCCSCWALLVLSFFHLFICLVQPSLVEFAVSPLCIHEDHMHLYFSIQFVCPVTSLKEPTFICGVQEVYSWAQTAHKVLRGSTVVINVLDSLFIFSTRMLRIKSVWSMQTFAVHKCLQVAILGWVTYWF